MDQQSVTMPDGSAFAFWDDRTVYERVLHVAREHPHASDGNPGTEDRPLVTIGRAAELLRAGEKAVVYGGVYRECVRPARGGEGPDRMIAYEAAPGERVIVRGSRVWRGPFGPSEGWRLGSGRRNERRGGPTVWMGDLPADWFVGYNPFAADNMSAEYTTFVADWSKDETRRMQLRRGMVFAGGTRLRQVFRCRDLAEQDAAFWVEDPGLRLHFRLPGDGDPGAAEIEVTFVEQLFAPAERGLGYIRVSGLKFEHGADGVPVPQRGAVSAQRGHHWIVEDCTIRWANSTALDLGAQSWHATTHDPAGGHIIRRNTVSDCGVCGIAGMGCVDGALLEDNVVERIGWQDIERIWETGGLKFHLAAGVLLRRNVFRHIHGAPGVWLDCGNRNCRITGNVFADIRTLQGACFIEMTYERNLVDGNVFWDIRTAGDRKGETPQGHPGGGLGVDVDTGDNCTIAHNLFAHIPDNYAVGIHLGQRSRIQDGRGGLGRRHRVLNNLFIACRKRIYLPRAEDNACDGNCYGREGDAASFCVFYPEPPAVLHLAAWREYFGLDEHSTEAAMSMDFDPDALRGACSLEGELPACAEVPELHGAGRYLGPGPFVEDGTEGWTGKRRILT